MTREREPSGVLVVDKPKGPTSHDVVGRLRRRLGTRRVGHAGTLDPMATGVLVILFGEGTKLEPFLSSTHKRYRAGVELGAGTSTLDAEGEITARGQVPAGVLQELARLSAEPASEAPLLEAALALERARTAQVPPAYSAIKVDGVRSHARARAGEQVELPPRPVAVRAARVVAASQEPARLELELEVSKGYYVRSFARDLGLALGCPAHLASLVRTQAGPFRLEEALALEDASLDLLALSRSLASAASACLPRVSLDEAQTRLVRAGRGLDPARVAACAELPSGQPVALLDLSSRHLIAVAERRPEELAPLRVFHDGP